MDNVITPQSH